MPKSLKNVNLLASELFLILKLLNQDKETQKYLKENSKIGSIILKEILSDVSIMNPENGVISELVLDILNETLFNKISIKNSIKNLEKKELIFHELISEENYEILDEILEIIDLENLVGDKNPNQKTIEKIFELLANLASCDCKIAEEIQKRNGMKLLINLWENLWKKDNNNFPIKKFGAFIRALSKIPNGYNEIVTSKKIIPKVIIYLIFH